MLKRLFAVLGCVLLVITCFVVPVGAVTIQGEPVAILTNNRDGINYGTDFYLRTLDNVDPYTLENGYRYYVSQFDFQFDNQEYVVVSSTSPTLDTLLFSFDYNNIFMSAYLEYEEIDVATYHLLTDQGFDGNWWYLGGSEFPGDFTFYVYRSNDDPGWDSAFDQGYDEGYDDGYDEGVKDGKNLGYDEGYDEGERYGYDRGYRSGLEDGSGITWTGLFTSAIEVPVNVLQGILNFEILGVNLWSFFGAIVALCVVLIVVKWVV